MKTEISDEGEPLHAMKTLQIATSLAESRVTMKGMSVNAALY